MEAFRKDATFLAPFEGCGIYCNAICRYKSIGDTVSVQHRFFSQMSSLVLALVENTDLIDSILLQMLEMGDDEAKKVRDTKPG